MVDTPSPVCFIDTIGGAIAVLAAGIARLHGDTSALAATTAPVRLGAEIAGALGEVGASAPEVLAASNVPSNAERVDVSSWDITLWEGAGEFERMASARIARDVVERRIDALHARA